MAADQERVDDETSAPEPQPSYFYCVMNGYGQLSDGALSDSMDIA